MVTTSLARKFDDSQAEELVVVGSGMSMLYNNPETGLSSNNYIKLFLGLEIIPVVLRKNRRTLMFNCRMLNFLQLCVKQA